MAAANFSTDKFYFQSNGWFIDADIPSQYRGPHTTRLEAERALASYKKVSAGRERYLRELFDTPLELVPLGQENLQVSDKSLHRRRWV